VSVSSENVECMLHRCEKCPGISGIKEVIEDSGIIWPAESVKYQTLQVDKNRAALVNTEEDVISYKKDLIQDI